ncbi:hypothetical protein KKD37_03890 [Patescibacteria group bacterium]|nr:hypothetical protein [Patescibacteria group bacterium]
MKKNKSISDQVLTSITQKKLRPIPKWEFVAKTWILWFGLIISLVLLILGFGLSIFGFIDNVIVPYLWLLIAIIFFILSYFLFEKTKKAYRFDKKIILFLIVLLGLGIGGILFKTGLANRIDRGLETRSTYYRQIVPMKLQAWSNPQAGYLSGTITKIIAPDSFELTDFSQKVWTITSKNSQTEVRITPKIGVEVKLIGSQTAATKFTADEIRPWQGRRQNILKENR